MSYRFDKRTKEEYSKDILSAHSIEAEIAVRLCAFYFERDGVWPSLIPMGSDFTGKVIGDSEVSADADFLIDYVPVEITSSQNHCRSNFHQKQGKIEKAIKEKFHIVFADGVKTQSTRFVSLSPEKIKSFTNMSKEKFGTDVPMPGRGGSGWLKKRAYRYNLSWFNGMWEKLPPTPKDLPESYQNILNCIKTA